MVTLNTIIKLRRDTLLNYSKCGSHAPENGEVCIVDTVVGTRLKVGDGSTAFKNLPYIDSKMIAGYYFDGKFYAEYAHITELVAEENILYIDKATNSLYYWNGVVYIEISTTFPSASDDRPGILKLYTTLGQNTDGTMTQKAITDAIDAIAFDIELGEEELAEDNALILSKPSLA